MKQIFHILALLIPLLSITLGMGLITGALAQPESPEATQPADAGPEDAAPDEVADAAPEPGSGPAVDVPSPVDDPVGALAKFVSAVKAGNWREVVALALIFVSALLLWLTRRFDSAGDGLEEHDWGAVLFVFGTSFLGALGSALLVDGVTVDFALFRAAFVLAVLAAGGYGALWKKLLVPLIAKIRGK